MTLSAPPFTGEYLVPGVSPARMEADHLARYRFSALFARKRRVLDIACGMGYAAPMFVATGARQYVGVDLNPDLVAWARRSYSGNRVSFRVGDIADYRDREPYDLVVCFETIEHILDCGAALRCLRSVLAPGGLLLISSPNRAVTSPGRGRTDPPENPWHVHEFTPDELAREMRDAGFRLDRYVCGQRQRHRMLAHPWVARAARKLGIDPDETASPGVTLVNGKIPRYFILLAERADERSRPHE